MWHLAESVVIGARCDIFAAPKGVLRRAGAQSVPFSGNTRQPMDKVKPGIAAGPVCWALDLEVHTSHAAHSATARRHAASGRVLLRQFRYHGFGGYQESRH